MKIIITKIRARYLDDISRVVDEHIIYWNSTVEIKSRNQLRNWSFDALLVKKTIIEKKYENAIVEVFTKDGITYVFVF